MPMSETMARKPQDWEAGIGRIRQLLSRLLRECAQSREPLAEMYQIKGASECALGVGATDEECAFSQVFEPCEQGQETGCAFETAPIRSVTSRSATRIWNHQPT